MKGGRLYYDMPIGILCLESLFPKPRGHMRNPLTYGFPTVTRVIRGVDIPRLLFNPTPDLLEPFIQAAKELEADGVQAITGSCWLHGHVSRARSPPNCTSLFSCRACSSFLWCASYTGKRPRSASSPPVVRP